MKTASIFKDLEFNENKPVTKILFETAFTKEIRIALKTGVTMKKHKTSFPIIIEIIEGEIDFGVQEKILNLKKGDLIALDGGIPHDLKAKEDSIVRLTLNKSDKTDRVVALVK